MSLFYSGKYENDSEAFIIFLSVFIVSPLLLDAKKSLEDIPQRCEKRLEDDVLNIISSTEKEVFLQLEADKEREQLIESFWKQRDPRRGASEDEFKTDHCRRIDCASYTLGCGIQGHGLKTGREEI